MAHAAATARLLSDLDLTSSSSRSSSSLANLPEHPDSSFDSASTSPSSPSKDKMREWTFPRQTSPPTSFSSPSSSSSPPQSRSSAASRAAPVDVSTTHGRSSSIAPSTSPSLKRGVLNQNPMDSADTRPLLPRNPSSHSSADFRHRPNASLAFASSLTPEVSSSSRFSSAPLSPPATQHSFPSTPLSPPADGTAPSTSGAGPGNVARMVYSNVRRKGLNDLLYLVVFGGAFFLFLTALLGVGYEGSASSSSLAIKPSPRAGYADQGSRGEVVDVEIPAAYRREEMEDVLADVHQPLGDSSEDDGVEHFGETAEEWEEVVGDEKVHEHPSPDSRPASDPALFPDHDDAESQLFSEHADVVHRGPARLAAQASEAEDEQDEEEDVDAADISLGAEVAEVEEEEEEVDLDAIDYPQDADEEELVDDSISIHNPPIHSDGSLHLPDDDDFSSSSSGPHGVDGDDDDDGELSALEELLDASLKENEDEVEEIVGGREGREALEALARARGARVGGGGGRMERRKMVRERR